MNRKTGLHQKYEGSSLSAELERGEKILKVRQYELVDAKRTFVTYTRVNISSDKRVIN